jgi:Acetyltransferase (GNAT) domain
VFCRVESWLTGRRLVSLPFSDHCEPLVDTEQDLHPLAVALEEDVQREGWHYVETRPVGAFNLPTLLRGSVTQYSFHELSLSDDLQTIFRNFHKDSIQRKIRRAERERLTYKEGSTDALLQIFYKLFIETRKRHSLPPPPRQWFVNLIECFGAALKIRVAYLDNTPLAAIITIRHKNSLVYKYGAPDPRFTNLGSMHLLLWTSIQEAKDCKLGSFDFGRSDLHPRGLAIFKSRWGAAPSTLSYSRYGISGSLRHMLDLSSEWKSSAAKLVIAQLPPALLSTFGGGLYRHAG